MEQWLERLPIRTLATRGIVLCVVLYDGLTLVACVTSCCRDTREKTPHPKGPPARQALLPGSLGACATRLGMSGTRSRASGARPPRGRASRPVGAAVDGPWRQPRELGARLVLVWFWDRCIIHVFTLWNPPGLEVPHPEILVHLCGFLQRNPSHPRHQFPFVFLFIPPKPVSVKLLWGRCGVGGRSESQRPIPISSALKSVMRLPRRHLDSLPGARPWGGSLLSHSPKQQGPGHLDLFPLRFLSRPVSLKCSVLAGKCAASWFLSLFFFKSLSQRTVSPRVVAPCASSSYGPASLGWVFFFFLFSFFFFFF
eukprot:XP_022282250.1 uncharacterized protein LOC102156959 [Canis lupus familiaris]